ncbi:STAS domain-containing protein [Leptospira vanthielii]|uniref:Anti-sigma factor antagonist n=1 Tax=Leptospira vanthielii TaxID=293085 RepID=A0ABY2NSU9_9LEPT|nr:STAS domain-containing protein [Leptospira vanthielii]TGM60435.1 anti-sigma factor antagonist [Leptospira vanthielii]
MDVQVKDDIRIIKFSGAILKVDSDEIEKELSKLTQSSVKKIILDLTKVHHICSTALGIFVATKRKLKPMNGDIKVIVVDEDLIQLFEITMLDKVFEIFPDLSAAMEGFQLDEEDSN